MGMFLTSWEVGGGGVSTEAYCMSEYEVITRSAHRWLLKQHYWVKDLVIDVFVWSGVCFHSLHVLVGIALTKTSNACIFISVCTHVRNLHTCRNIRYLRCMQAALSVLTVTETVYKRSSSSS